MERFEHPQTPPPATAKKQSNTRYILLMLFMISGSLLFQQTAGSQSARGGGPGAKRGATPVKTVEVRPRTLQNKLTLTGTAVAAERFTIATETSGKLISLPLQLGQYVKNGQLIAQMEAQDFEQDLQQIQADLAVTEAQQREIQGNLKLAEAEYSRDAALYSKKLVSQTELDTSSTALETQRARLKVLEAQARQQRVALQGGKLRLADTRVYARWPGKGSRVVSQRLVDAGASVSANTPLVELVSLDPILVRTPVSEKDIAQVKAGQTVNMRTDAYPEKTYTGFIAHISPVLDPETRNATLEIQLSNPAHKLKPGMFLQGELILATHAQAQSIPLEALVERQDLPAGVFVLQADQTVKFVAVKTGFSDGDHLEIVSPKLTGPVITLGNHLLSDGAEVKVQSTTASKAPVDPAKQKKQAR